MKKVLTALILLISALLPASAQDIFESSNNRPYLGLRAGLDLTCPGKWDGMKLYKTGAGFDLGAIYNIPVWKNLYFEPGLMLYYSTVGSDVTVMADDLQSSRVNTRRFGFRIPFRFGYRFDFDTDLLTSISFFTGPQLELGLWGRERANFHDGFTFSSNCFKDSFNRANLGWEFGVDFTAGRFVFEIAGTAGMLNLAKFGNTFHQGNVQFNIGYNF